MATSTNAARRELRTAIENAIEDVIAGLASGNQNEEDDDARKD